MKTLVVYPHEKGHFINYFDLIYEGSNKTVFSLKTSSIIKIIKFCYSKNIAKVIFLHGDKDFLKALILKLLFFRIKTSIILYYSFESSKENILFKLKFFIIKLISFFRINIFFLEFNPSKLKCLSKKYSHKIYDPILLKRINSNKNKSSCKNYLVAGYLDERKNIDLLIKSLTELCHNDQKKRCITLLGEQSESVKMVLKKVKKTDNLIINQKNFRFSDRLFELELERADVVWAFYKKHFGSSSVVINSVFFNKNVIFKNIGILKDFSKNLNLNETIKSCSLNDIKTHLLKLETKKQYSSHSRKEFLNKRGKTQFINKLLY